MYYLQNKNKNSIKATISLKIMYVLQAKQKILKSMHVCEQNMFCRTIRLAMFFCRTHIIFKDQYINSVLHRTYFVK